MTKDWSEERIAAHVDGQLSADEAREVEALLARDEKARAYADRLRRANALLAEAFPLPKDATPAGIARALAPPRANVIPMKRKERPIWQPMALAASALVAVGLGAKLHYGDGFEPPAGPALSGSALQAALESAPSGIEVAGGITPMLTFRDQNNRFCREFEMTGELPGELEFGIACRNAAEGWDIEIIAAAPAPVETSEDYVPASGPAMAALEAVLDRLGGEIPLTPEEEERAIADGWDSDRP